VAEVFGVVWRKLDSSVVEAERAWVFGIARNVVRNRWRAATRRRQLLSRVGGFRQREGLDLSDEIAERRTRQGKVTEALRKLREADREILMMSAWDDLSASEIAVILDISVNAVHQRLHRAKNRLADAMNHLQEASNQRLATEEGRA
jgi:RNA polymerase sigma factor (sigma-70 family)